MKKTKQRPDTIYIYKALSYVLAVFVKNIYYIFKAWVTRQPFNESLRSFVQSIQTFQVQLELLIFSFLRFPLQDPCIMRVIFFLVLQR